MKIKLLDSTLPLAPLRGARGRADLLWALKLADGDPDKQTALAAVLGFQAKPKKIPEPDLPQDTPQPKPSTAPKTEAAIPSPPPQAETKPYRLESIEQTADGQAWQQAQTEPMPLEYLTKEDQDAWDKQAIAPASPALVPWTRLWPRLREAVAEVFDGKIDLPKLADTLARGRPVKRLPRRRQLAWPAELTVILDFSDRLTPYWEDWHALARHLAQRWPKSTRLYRLKGAPPGTLRHWTDKGFAPRQLPWPKPQAQGNLLVIGDLGMVDAAHPWPRERWAETLTAYRRQGVRVVCLAPVSKHHLSTPLSQLADIVRLSPDSDLRPLRVTAATVEHQATSHPALQDLLAMLSVASRVEPPLLRALRACLPEAAGDAGLEGELWCHPELDTAATACALSPWAVEEWRREFEKLPGDLQKKTLDCLRYWHSHLPQAIHHEETLLWRHLAESGHAEEDNAKPARLFFGRVQNTLASQDRPMGPGARQVLAQFAGRHVVWLAPTLGEREPYLSRLYAAVALAQPELALDELPSGVDPATWLRERPPQATRTAVLMQYPDRRLGLLMQEADVDPRLRFELTPLATLVLTRDALLWGFAREGEPVEFQPWLWESEADANAPMLPTLLQTPDENSPQPEPFYLHTGQHLLRFHPTERPPWATALSQDWRGLYGENASASRYYWLGPRMGRTGQPLPGFWGSLDVPEWANGGGGLDDYGAYAVLSVQGIAQRFRWIPPGQFRMGSPADEPGRRSNEGPQHPVVLTEGFWLADTPCTQAFWVAVMNQNPSRFQTPDRPVEQVSWQDAQGFIHRLNALAPGLDLALPTEAQWEYACRAGTDTALYTGPIEILGANNASALDAIAWYGGNSGVGFELDNGFDSTSWTDKQYPDSPSGTHPVGRKLANSWGLFDMLGNVWEWCQDWYASDYYTQLAGHSQHTAGASEQSASGSASERTIPPFAKGGLGGISSENPSGPASGSNRVVRGGSWNLGADYCRSAYRNYYFPSYRNGLLGFRLSRTGPLHSYPFTLGNAEPEKPAVPKFIAGLRDPLHDGSEGPAMAWLPGGEFMMGQDDGSYGDEKPAHPVRVDAISIGQYPVTFAEYDRFCSATQRKPPADQGWGRGDRPAINVSWQDAKDYCEWLCQQTGEHYRLATEAEWEYACRSGSTTRYCYGDDESGLDEYAWYSKNANRQTHPVGQKKPNAWQLYDLHGNVWEWCADWYASDYYQQLVDAVGRNKVVPRPFPAEEGSPETPASGLIPVYDTASVSEQSTSGSASGREQLASENPSGPASGSLRVVRGGSWHDDAVNCRSAYRDLNDPSFRVSLLGFRLSRTGPWHSHPITLGTAPIVPTLPRGNAYSDAPASPDREAVQPGFHAGASEPAETKPRFQDYQVFHDSLASEAKGGEGPAMVYLPGGTFLMGDEKGSDDEKPVHPVRLSAFAMGRTPVTIGEYLKFCQATDSHWPEWLKPGSQYHIATGNNDYYRKRGITLRELSADEKRDGTRNYSGLDPQCLDLPIVGISWDDAVAYCQWLSEATGETYALPTEAQWEYACRAGNPGRWCFGDDEKQLVDYAWYGENSENKLHPVMGKAANAFGLYDVHGNVWEWCADWYSNDYYTQLAGHSQHTASASEQSASGSASEREQSASENPSGPASGSLRVVRGGSWLYVADRCRSALRGRDDPSNRDGDLGFRLSRTV